MFYKSSMIQAGASNAGAFAEVRNTTFPAYLDLWRWIASSAVVLSHIKLLQVGPLAMRQLFPGFGHDFVVVFFVLSGYVIAWSADRKTTGGIGFALDRAARIYSVAIPTLLISAFLSWALNTGTPSDIISSTGFGLIFLGQSWSLNIFPPDNPPFWSLPYEVLYYALFGCAFYLRGAARIVAVIVVALLAGPKVLLLLPCWLAGVAIYRLPDVLGRVSACVVAVGALACLLMVDILNLGQILSNPFPGMDLKHSSWFGKDWVTAALIAAHFYAVRQVPMNMPARLAAWSVAGAAVTFEMYLIHYPIIMTMKNQFGAGHGSLACLVATLFVVAGITVGLARFTGPWRKQLRAAFEKLARGRRDAALTPTQ